jgi:saccharopine dehydrogenase-like NADP-dependent oxidoreductase
VNDERYTVAVLGAGGTIGPAVVRDLAESDEVEVEGMRLLDVDGERAAAVAATHGRGRANAAAVDARRNLAEAIAGCDVVVNCASYRVNIETMKACLQSRCHYLDLGGLYWMTGKQLAMHRDFEKAGLVAVLGIGSSPGKTNVMARRAARELERIDRVDVSAAGRDLSPPEGFSVPYALRTLLDEVTMPPVVLRDGKPVEIDPLTAGGAVDFGPEIGEAPTIYTLHSEMRTFGDSFGANEGSFRLSLSEPLLEKLRGLAGASPEEQREAAAETVPPSPNTISAHVVEASGDGRRVRVTSLTRPNPAWNLGGGVISTAAPAAATVRLLQRGQIEARGALPPERCIDPDHLLPELERRGAEFGVDVSDEVAA